MKIDKRLLAEARIARLHLMLTVGLGFLVGLVIVLQALFLSRAVSSVFLGGQELADVKGVLAMLAALALLRAALRWGSDASAQRLARQVKADLRGRLMACIVSLGPAHAALERSGELTTTVVEGVEALDAYFSEYLPQLALAVVMPLTILVFVLPLDWISGLVLLLTAPLIPLFMVLIGSAADTLAKRQWVTLSRLAARFLDALQGLPTLKVFGRSRDEAATIARISDEYRRTTMGVLRVAFLSSMALELLATLSVAVVAVEIGLRVLYGRMAFADAFFILVLAPDFYAPLRLLGSRFHSGMAGVAAADRIFEILDQAPVGTPSVSPVASPSASASVSPVASSEVSSSVSSALPQRLPAPDLRRTPIRFEGVHFSYETNGSRDGRRRAALAGVSFELPPGGKVALVGPSGAGKSTVVQLLLRFVAPTGGTVVVGDRSLLELDVRGWREQIAWVPQRPYLFNTSVAENIRLGRAQATTDDVRRAARLAHADEFIDALPQGYDTVVGERGSLLSAGQVQRLALARAFLRQAPLVVLDEATANLDPQTEDSVRQAMTRLLAGRTALIVAHRLTTVTEVDRILVLDEGRVVQQGTHSELMRDERADGLYRHLVRAYGGVS
jgi:thiol reductant ABC exporter CydD subunit